MNPSENAWVPPFVSSLELDSSSRQNFLLPSHPPFFVSEALKATGWTEHYGWLGSGLVRTKSPAAKRRIQSSRQLGIELNARTAVEQVMVGICWPFEEKMCKVDGEE